MKLAVASVALVLFLAPLPIVAQGVGALTLREGPIRLIRGTAVLQGAEGMRLRPGDILESADKGFAQVELTGGTVVALGAASRLLLLSFRTDRNGQPDELVLLSGWLKAESGDSTRADRYASPLLAATTKSGTIVLHTGADASEAFFESGSGTLSPVNAAGNPGAALAAKPGQFFSRRSGKDILNGSRPDSTFVDSMPLPFRDTLPSRLSRFTGKPAEPKADHEVAYSEIAPWLRIGTAWRRSFVERFRPRLRDPEFRRALEAHLRDYPEWDVVLHPEKYQPSSSPAASQSSPPRGR